MNKIIPIRRWFSVPRAQAVPLSRRLYCNPELPAGWQPQTAAAERNLNERGGRGDRPERYIPSFGSQTIAA